MLLWGWWGWIHVTTQGRWWVEILLLTRRWWLCISSQLGWCWRGAYVTLLGLGLLCVILLLPVLVLRFHFFCLWGETGKFAHQLYPEVLVPEVLAVSEVSPFEVEEALGINAQQWEACFWLLQCLQKTLRSLQYDFKWLFIPHLRHMGGMPELFGRLVPMPSVCPCSDFTLSFGTVLPLGGKFGKGVCQICSSSGLVTGVGWGWGWGWGWG